MNPKALVSYAITKDGRLILRDAVLEVAGVLSDGAVDAIRRQLFYKDTVIDGMPVILSITKLETP